MKRPFSLRYIEHPLYYWKYDVANKFNSPEVKENLLFEQIASQYERNRTFILRLLLQ